MAESWTRRRFLGLAAAALPVQLVPGNGSDAAAGAAAGASAGPSTLATAAAASTPKVPPGFAGGPTPAPRGAADVALASPPAYRLEHYRGLGCWIDVFDWSTSYAAGGVPTVTAADMTSLAARGVRTVYLQTARYDRPGLGDDLLERSRLFGLVDAAHAAGMAVVAWYLPTHVDQGLDLRRCWAVLGAGATFDGLALDIESRAEPDVGLRNARLADLVVRVRAAVGPAAAVGAIVVPPTTMEDVNPNYWPGFDWALLADQCDVFLPMNYWTNRLSSSPWRDAAASSAENIRRLRAHAGRADYPVHVVGGIANEVTFAEVQAMVAAVIATGGDGASLYDVATTPTGLWPALAGLPS